MADCWSESFGCGGLTLASELGQSQLPDVLQKPASKGNSSTIATPNKQCQTQLSVGFVHRKGSLGVAVQK